MKAGIAYVSEDRIGQSLVMDFGILTNASLPVIDQATRLGLIQNERELDLVKPHLDRLRLRFRSFDQPVSTLSGGNQQKVALSKWLATTPRTIIFDEPTQGVDVQTKAEVHAMIAALARHGLAIILISSDLPELVSMCHRILVLKEGGWTADFLATKFARENYVCSDRRERRTKEFRRNAAFDPAAEKPRSSDDPSECPLRWIPPLSGFPRRSAWHRPSSQGSGPARTGSHHCDGGRGDPGFRS